MNRSFGSVHGAVARGPPITTTFPKARVIWWANSAASLNASRTLGLFMSPTKTRPSDLLGPLVEGFLLIRVHKKPHLHITGFEQCIA